MAFLKRRRFGGSGSIARLVTARGFGFIEGLKKEDIYFHSYELVNVSFDELQEGDKVGFELVTSTNRLSAINVQKTGHGDGTEEVDRADGAPESKMRAAVKMFTSLLAESIARDPDILNCLEWRDLERLIAEVFSGLGFDVEIKQGSKDKGEDVIVNYSSRRGEHMTYSIQIKHWRSGKRVGTNVLREFLHVIAREGRSGGLLLATNGFGKRAVEMVTEIDRNIMTLSNIVGLGDEKKVVALCRSYVSSGSGTWYPPDQLGKVIFEDTI